MTVCVCATVCAFPQACTVLEGEIERARAMLSDAEARKAAAESNLATYSEREAKQREELHRLQVPAVCACV